MQNLGDGGQIRCIMGNVEVMNARDSALTVKRYYQSYESGGGKGGGGEGEGGLLSGTTHTSRASASH